MRPLNGIKVRDDIHWFSNSEKAYEFGELMAENGFTSEFQNHGNCMAVITSHIEPTKKEQAH